jgi:hypothetical protein
VFTRQFTAFDRQNAESAESTFHGFFTLFWLGTAIFVMQLAAKNWQAHGHILGTNEIMKFSMNRDLIVLAISDGVLCGSTGFGWVLQKLILKDYLSWNKEGWIIQAVSFLRSTLAFHSQDIASNLHLDLGFFLRNRFSFLDAVSRMALDAHRFLRPTWSYHAYEAAQLRIL